MKNKLSVPNELTTAKLIDQLEFNELKDGQEKAAFAFEKGYKSAKNLRERTNKIVLPDEYKLAGEGYELT